MYLYSDQNEASSHSQRKNNSHFLSTYCIIGT